MDERVLMIHTFDLAKKNTNKISRSNHLGKSSHLETHTRCRENWKGGKDAPPSSEGESKFVPINYY